MTMKIFVLTMLHHPDICKKVRDEIDRVVGRDRLPAFEDKELLSYTRAAIIESQRWRPVSPIGVCHSSTEVSHSRAADVFRGVLADETSATTQDDTYEGMFIPKGTRIFPSLWSV